ncbi:TetR/AcrR family transcriptional regulator [Amycolatopsis pithecellobii]|uniref:TetR family transcriptional regulator n=1 Tax=Amycolatopsis pithecellobii TaxID=664692 RepID=A0A6N7YZC3_9PSEU|nr:TetR family transcriptional regulator [Amycolatopsis pithecellobii]MTD53759.1 TetR family transcriptional regulator [Amycolatopsis pithecellobii]
MSQAKFLRARSPEHKQERRDAILSAARDLATASGVRNVTLGAIADAVGLAKSNVVRYFGTREEIYLALTAECWREWAAEVLRRLAAGDGVVDALAETLAARTLLCDLLSQMQINLEHNVAVPAASDFKRTALDALTELGKAVAAADPTLTDDESFELVGAAMAFAGTFYPASKPSPTMAEVYAQHPELAFACLPFLPTLKRILRILLAGLHATRD